MTELAVTVRALVVAVCSQSVSDVLAPGLGWRDLGVDSLDLLDLVVRCEDELDVELPDAVVVHLPGPAALLAYLTGLR